MSDEPTEEGGTLLDELAERHGRKKVLDVFDSALDREEMLREMGRNPAGFLRMRICTDGVPWARLHIEPSYGDASLVVSFEVRRGKFAGRPTEFDEHLSSSDVVRHYPNASSRLNQRFLVDTGSRHLESEFDRLVANIAGIGRAFFGHGGWSLVEVISNGQAWKRIKHLRGYPVEGDPWA